jgi:hypothetical protein
MRFYSFDEIRAAGDCAAYAEQVLGVKLKHGRCPAIWRGGDGDNVAIDRDKWFDHRSKEGGGIIELAAVARHDGNIQAAQQWLGEWLGLEPKRVTVKHDTATAGSSRRYEELVAQGYRETRRYAYENEEGELVHFVVRMEHQDKPKEFLQGTPAGWGLRGVTPILYRLRDWVNRPWVAIVEGEKDADTLAALGIPATTNCGGAEKWRPEYSLRFAGKNVVIIRDNDEAGERHAQRVAAELKNQARAVRVICPSALPKGDVTDWMEREAGSAAKLMDMIRNAPEINLAEIVLPDPAIDRAKRANQHDLRNYIEVKMQVGNVTKVTKSPRQIMELVDDIHARFLGFPRRIRGTDSVFDHDRDSSEIVEIHDSNDFMSWMGRKSKRRIVWAQGEGLVTKPEIFAAIRSEAMTYEGVSQVPDWPRRMDVYYAHPSMPDPSPDYEVFNGLLEFFNPSNAGYRTLMKALIVAPIWYTPKIPRPGWIVDSHDGAGVGKTTLVEVIGVLYRSGLVRTNRHELKNKTDEVNKRLLSAKGRQARMFLVDNVVGTFHSAELADMMTAQDISGRAAYGRGEESRPNNLTYVITSNSASVDNDLADRCYYVLLDKPRRMGAWKQSLLAYIERHRMQIFADIIHMLDNADQLECDPVTRFPEFEEAILRGVCADHHEYAAAITAMNESKQASNVEEEHARTIEDEFASRLSDANRRSGTEMIFIRSEVVRKWMEEILPEITAGMQYIRNLAKNGLTPRFSAKPERYPHNGPQRRRGILWLPVEHDGGSTRIIGLKNGKITEIVS